jgi:ArsR family transcriptional regulator
LLKPQGRLLVLELMPHQESWVKAQLGHQHLGFEPEALNEALKRTGFVDIQLTHSPRDGLAGFRAFLLTALRPVMSAKRERLTARATVEET